MEDKAKLYAWRIIYANLPDDEALKKIFTYSLFEKKFAELVKKELNSIFEHIASQARAKIEELEHDRETERGEDE